MKKVRGIWLTNVDSDVYASKDNIFQAIELLSKTGFNVVFPVVWNKGYTLYRSKVMEQHFGSGFVIDPLYQAASRDPLAEIIDAGKTFKLKVIPWFEFGFAASAVQKTSTGLQEFGEHILKKKPNFAAVNHSGLPLIKPAPIKVDDIGFKWMNALNPEVQAFMRDLILEVAQNYDVDGIQGDDRLPAFPVEGFDQDAANRFKAKHGHFPTGAKDEKWMQFRADILTQFLKALCQQVRQVGDSKGKKLLISMAPHPRGFGFREFLQDTKAWFDLVDMMHPQLYRKEFDKYKDLVKDEIVSLSSAQKAKISPGVLMKLGDYRIDEEPNHLKNAINLNRSTGFAGEVFFFFEGLRKPDESTAKALRDPHYAVIKRDDEGPDVFKIQNLLIAKGFNPGEPDGIFGTKTEEAVKKFQIDPSHVPPLKVDGQVGQKTLEKLGISGLQVFGNLSLRDGILS
jgi:uncharacterized lipoprotein YddW (UPF0748 family)